MRGPSLAIYLSEICFSFGGLFGAQLGEGRAAYVELLPSQSEKTCREDQGSFRKRGGHRGLLQHSSLQAPLPTGPGAGRVTGYGLCAGPRAARSGAFRPGARKNVTGALPL